MYMYKKCINITVFFIFTTLSSTGCSLFDRNISLTHTPVVKKRIKNQKIIYIGTVIEKKQSFRQGVVKNGYGMDVGNIYLDPPPYVLLRNALELELKNAGFRVYNSSSKYPFIDMRINKIFHEPEVGLFGEDAYVVVDADIIIQVNSKTAFKKRITGIGKRNSCFLGINSIVAFNNGINDFMEKAVPAIIDFIELDQNKNKK